MANKVDALVSGGSDFYAGKIVDFQPQQSQMMVIREAGLTRADILAAFRKRPPITVQHQINNCVVDVQSLLTKHQKPYLKLQLTDCFGPIEALVYLKRTEEAERRFAAFKSRYPASSHRVHLDSLFAGSAGAPTRP